MPKLMNIPSEFFLNDSIHVARKLLGAVIVTNKNGQITSGRITETECYPSWDGASHAYNGKVTKRTEIQFAKGGCLYLYLIMGLHIMTSIVVNREDFADVVFIRSIEPIDGIDIMKIRRNYFGSDIKVLACGPGRLTKALGINMSDNGCTLNEVNSIVSIYVDSEFQKYTISAGPRINLGVDRLSNREKQLSMKRKWRFFLKGSKYLSSVKSLRVH
jgi:DNA-3-methyladenine glycosylase